MLEMWYCFLCVVLIACVTGFLGSLFDDKDD